MPFTIEMHDGRSCPVITCDQCGQRVTAADRAVLCWQMTEPARTAPPVLLHADCTPAFEGERSGIWRTADLDTALVELMHNVGMSAAVRKRAEWKARMLARIEV